MKTNRTLLPRSSPDAERLTAACALSVIGGFLDIYTYLCRGGVFANAVTGNMVLLGFNLANRRWENCGKYLLAIFCYALGVFAAEFLRARLPRLRGTTWQQSVVLIELICLSAVCFIPYGGWDDLVNALIAFVCALQVQTFRRVHGLPFASTMCTGNLRSGTDALFRGLIHREPGAVVQALHYYGVIICFIGGAAAGAALLSCFNRFVFLLAPAGLAAVFLLITTKRELAAWTRSFRHRFRR